MNTPIPMTSGGKGSIRAYHFLADNPTDRTKIISIAGLDVVNFLFFENIDVSGGVTSGSYIGIATSRWATGTFNVSATGATSTILGISSLIMGISALI